MTHQSFEKKSTNPAPEKGPIPHGASPVANDDLATFRHPAVPVVETKVTEARESTAVVKTAGLWTTLRQDSRNLFSTVQRMRAFVREIDSSLASEYVRLSNIIAASSAANVFLLGNIITAMASRDIHQALALGAAFGGVQAAVPFLQAKRDLVGARLLEKVSAGSEKEFVSQVHSLGFPAMSDGKCQEIVEEVRSNSGSVGSLMRGVQGLNHQLVGVGASLCAIASASPWSSALLLGCAAPMFYLQIKNASLVKKVEDALAAVYKQFYPVKWMATDKEVAVELKVCRKSEWVNKSIAGFAEAIVDKRDELLRSNYKLSCIEAKLNALVGLGVATSAVTQTAWGQMGVGSLSIILGGVTGLQYSLSSMGKEFGAIKKNAFFTDMLFGLGKLQPTNAPIEKQWSPAEVNAITKKLNEHRISIILDGVQVNVDGPNGECKTILAVDNMEIPWGKMVGVVGLKGAGKSTLVSVLLGIRAPCKGTVTLVLHKDNGEPSEKLALNEIPIQAWHNQIGYTPQNAYSGYSISVKDSIDLGKNEFDEDPLSYERALEISGAGKFISADKIGVTRFSWDSGENMRRFSGGEIRAIVNTRAIIGNRKFLMLDEPTSGQDALTEGEITDQLSSFKGIKTQIIVSHSFGALRETELVIEVEGGVARIGTHAELLRNNDGIYSRLRAAQERGLKWPSGQVDV